MLYRTSFPSIPSQSTPPIQKCEYYNLNKILFMINYKQHWKSQSICTSLFCITFQIIVFMTIITSSSSSFILNCKCSRDLRADVFKGVTDLSLNSQHIGIVIRYIEKILDLPIKKLLETTMLVLALTWYCQIYPAFRHHERQNGGRRQALSQPLHTAT